MGDPADGDERKRKFGSEDPTIHESAGTEGETLGPESAMDSIRTSHGVDADPGVELDAGPVAPPASGHRRYTVRGEIARGGMGAIFKVRDEDLRRSLAMKVMLGKVSRKPSDRAPFEPDRLARFLEEAQVTAQLAHPGVVPVHELGTDDSGRVFFTMSLVRGKTLSEIITLAREGREGWDRARALQTLLRVCETVAFAHDKGVIHRDLKPANIMVGKFGEVYVMDWGLAKVRGQQDRHDIRLRAPDAPTSTRIETDRTESQSDHDSPIMTMDGAVVGTPCYMPPEQAKGQVEEVDERSDVYAIGAMLYQLLTGQPPYIEPGARISPRTLLVRVLSGPPQPIQGLAPDTPVELQAIAQKAMDRDQAARYESAKSLAEDVQRFLSGHVVQAHKTGAVVELRMWLRRNRRFAAVVATGLTVLATVTSYFVYELGVAREVLDSIEQTSAPVVAPAHAADADRLERGTDATTVAPSVGGASDALGLLMGAADDGLLSSEETGTLRAHREVLANAPEQRDATAMIAAGAARLDGAPVAPGHVLGPGSRLEPTDDLVLVRSSGGGLCAVFTDADLRTTEDGSLRLSRGRGVVALEGSDRLLLPVGALAAPGSEGGRRWCATIDVPPEADGSASVALAVTHGKCELRRGEYTVLLTAGDRVVVAGHGAADADQHPTTLIVETASVGVVEWRHEAAGIIAAYVPTGMEVTTQWVWEELEGRLLWPWDFGFDLQFTWLPGGTRERLKIRVPVESDPRARVEIATFFPGRKPQRAELGPGTYAFIDGSVGVVATDLWPYAIVLIGVMLAIGVIVLVRRA